MSAKPFFVHPTAIVDDGARIGDGTKVWHFSHIMSGAVIGKDCVLGQNVYVAATVRIGNHVKIQNNVSLYDGVEVEDEAFCGPSAVFTNVRNPRSEVARRDAYEHTLVRRGATIGANATIVCGTTIGRYALVGAGAVVTCPDVPDYALMLGVPARQEGWVSRHGHVLLGADRDGILRCPESGWRYQISGSRQMRCLDFREDEAFSKRNPSE